MDNQLQQKDIANLTENLRRLEATMSVGFNNVNTRLDVMNDHFIRKDFFDDKIKSLNEDIAELKDSNTWLFRTIGGIIITTVLTGGILAFTVLG